MLNNVRKKKKKKIPYIFTFAIGKIDISIARQRNILKFIFKSDIELSIFVKEFNLVPWLSPSVNNVNIVYICTKDSGAILAEAKFYTQDPTLVTLKESRIDIYNLSRGGGSLVKERCTVFPSSFCT